MSITEFILARVAEDEYAANLTYETCFVGTIEGRGSRYDLAVRMAPARVLAECEAKRTILREHAATGEDAWKSTYVCEACLTDRDGYSDDWGPDQWPCRTVRSLAAIWAGHDDYRKEWA